MPPELKTALTTAAKSMFKTFDKILPLASASLSKDAAAVFGMTDVLDTRALGHEGVVG
jgi:hypothetical protein